MKRIFLNAILFTVFLVSCAPQEIPAQVTVTPEATAVIYEPAIPALLLTSPAPGKSSNTPPEYILDDGGDVVDVKDESIQELQDFQWLSMFKMVNKLEGQKVTGTKDANGDEVSWITREDFHQSMAEFQKSHPEFEMKSKQDEETGRVIVWIQEDMGGGIFKTYYMFTKDGAMANPDPMWDGHLAEFREGIVQKGESDFRLNHAEGDGQWYEYRLSDDGTTPWVWLNTAGATKESVKEGGESWVEMDKPITDLTAWEKSEGDRIAKEAGFASYAEYVQKKLVENPAYDTEGEWGGSKGEPYVYATAEGLVMEQATVPIFSDYWKAKGVEKAEVLLMAFEHTTQPISVLAGFHLSDGTYISMLPLEVGVDADNRGQDKLLKKPSSLAHLVGQLRSVRMVDRLNSGPDVDLVNTENNWEGLKTYKDRIPNKYYNIFEARSAKELTYFEYALYNPEGYVRNNSKRDLKINPPEELLQLVGSDVGDAETSVAVQIYNLTHLGGGADSWMVVMALGYNEGVFSR